MKKRTVNFSRRGVVERVKASARLEGGEISPELEAVLSEYERTGDSSVVLEYMNKLLREMV